jgi:hypothetical protein
VAVSKDGGHTFTDLAVPCSYTKGKDLDHNFPNVSATPDGPLWYAWSDDTNVKTAVSHDHGKTWKCSGPRRLAHLHRLCGPDRRHAGRASRTDR